jgi:threonyl-tRNA synthetase
MLVIGDREAESEGVALRRHGEGDLGTIALQEAIARLGDEALARR